MAEVNETQAKTTDASADANAKVKAKKVGFLKIIENDFFILGHYIKDEFFELTGEEAKHPKVQNAIKNGLIKKK